MLLQYNDAVQMCDAQKQQTATADLDHIKAASRRQAETC